MSVLCDLSQNTESYLAEYNRILAQMASSMESAAVNASVSGTFIRQMLPHHRAAIAMSENLLRYTTNLQLQRIAQNIVTEQTRSICDMLRIQRICANTLNTPQSAARYAQCVGSIIETMLTAMETAPALNSIDCDFIAEMIPHHEGAIRMSRLALRSPLCPGLIPIINAILSSQSRGVRELNQLRLALKCRN